MLTILPNNNIRIVQGDTGILDFSITNHKLQTGDKVYLTVKKNYQSEALIFKEVTEFTNGKAKFILTPLDTNLEVGNYLYDVQCNLADGRVDTVITATKFQVLGGVTNA